ncbi:MAG TPA: class I SAM-dependent methyltransferase [Terriglobales bacterium]|nr:class I SAM-dependent methyltransferase [Terriglobales bacterium]
MDRTQHWNAVYAGREEGQASWFEAAPELSLRLLAAAGLGGETAVVDIGGGEARLVDALLARGVRRLTVLDISGEALRRAQARLGKAAAEAVSWIEADVAGAWRLPPVDLWHDRAVFHFLTRPEERAAYRGHLLETLQPGGGAVIATFALEGPERCSGLPVARYSPATLAQELGPELRLVEALEHVHHTPTGAAQAFQYSRFIRLG